MFTAFSLIVSSAILFFVLRYRVHVHVTYTPRTSRRVSRYAPEAGRQDSRPCRPTPAAQQGGTRQRESLANLGGGSKGNPLASDLISALIGLGSKPAAAKKATERALAHQDQDFERALRRAIDYASKAA